MSNPTRKQIAKAVSGAIEKHKYEHQGLCACGTDLGAAHGQQKAAYREHTKQAVTDAVCAAVDDPADAATVTAFEAFELRTANLIAYLDYMTRVGAAGGVVGDLVEIVSARVIPGLSALPSESTKEADK